MHAHLQHESAEEAEAPEAIIGEREITRPH
jgi:hypothetical protein